jgi:hypothetical protein
MTTTSLPLPPSARPRPPGVLSRYAAAALTGTAALVGGWALAAPASFYRGFPVSGHPWVAGLGAYDEHLVRDVGALYLALGVVSGWAVLRPARETGRLAGIAWLVFSLPHLLFHAGHHGVLGAGDALGSVLALGGTVVLAAVLAVAPGPAREGSGR